MGKKQHVRVPTTAPSSVKGAALQGAKAKAQPVSALAALMEEAQALMQKLETSATSLTSEDSDTTVQRLLERYKQMSIKNKVDSKREELLQTEISDYQMRNGEATDEVRVLREEYHVRQAKVEKLDRLSKTLSNRLRSVEMKATDDVKEEKESRLKMSYEFSATIKDISAKLDLLGKKREQIVTENNRLKQVLRDCLEDFDKDQEAARLAEAEEARAAAGKAEQDAAMLVADAKEPAAEEEQKDVQDEHKDMSMEDDLSRIMHLRAKEETLKTHTLRFMEIFDSFQVRLTKSNQLFQIKQGAVEEMTRRIKLQEKGNQQLASRIADCTSSTKNLLDSVERLRVEKNKYEKMLDKHGALIAKFTADIQAMDSGAK